MKTICTLHLDSVTKLSSSSLFIGFCLCMLLETSANKFFLLLPFSVKVKDELWQRCSVGDLVRSEWGWGSSGDTDISRISITMSKNVLTALFIKKVKMHITFDEQHIHCTINWSTASQPMKLLVHELTMPTGRKDIQQHSVSLVLPPVYKLERLYTSSQVVYFSNSPYVQYSKWYNTQSVSKFRNKWQNTEPTTSIFNNKWHKTMRTHAWACACMRIISSTVLSIHTGVQIKQICKLSGPVWVRHSRQPVLLLVSKFWVEN